MPVCTYRQSVQAPCREKMAPRQRRCLEARARALLGRPFETITPERGKQFARHVELTKALRGVQFCFCELHHPWQKPTVKNTDGLIREFLLRGDRL